jgi:hypothetical protein
VLRRFAEYHDLEGAFGRRALTERAKGILMERHAIDDGERVRDAARTLAHAPTARLVDLAAPSSTAIACSPAAAASAASVLTLARPVHGQRPGGGGTTNAMHVMWPFARRRGVVQERVRKWIPSRPSSEKPEAGPGGDVEDEARVVPAFVLLGVDVDGHPAQLAEQGVVGADQQLARLVGRGASCRRSSHRIGRA